MLYCYQLLTQIRVATCGDMAPDQMQDSRREKAILTSNASPYNDQQQIPHGELNKVRPEIRQKIDRDYFELCKCKPDETGPTLLCTNRTINSEARPICTAVVRSSTSPVVRQAYHR